MRRGKKGKQHAWRLTYTNQVSLEGVCVCEGKQGELIGRRGCTWAPGAGDRDDHRWFVGGMGLGEGPQETSG